MLQNIHSILIGVTKKGTRRKRSSALAYGLSLAREAGAHVTVQAASLKLVLTHAFVSNIAEDLVAAENRRLDALAHAAADAVAAGRGDLGPRLHHRSAAAGLSGSGQELRRPGRAPRPDGTGRRAGCPGRRPWADRGGADGQRAPLIVVPPGREAFAGTRIVVAWDGSAKAARALNDALPFLREAEQVELVSVTGEKDLENTVSWCRHRPASHPPWRQGRAS